MPELPTLSAEASAVGRRHLVPSRRERDAGVSTATDVPDQTAVIAAAEVSADGRMSPRALLSSLDPRAVAAHGSLLPLAVLFLAGVFFTVELDGFPTLFPDVQRSLGFSVGFVFTFASAVFFITTLFQPMLGYLTDRVHRVWMLRLGLVVSHAAFAASGAAGSVGALLGGQVGWRSGQPVNQSVSVPLLTDYYPPAVRGRVYSILFLSAPVGIILGPGAMGGLAQLVGWRAAVIGVGALGTLAALGTFLLREPIRGALDRKAMGASDEVARRAQRTMTWTESWRACARIRTLRTLWLAYPFIGVQAALGGTTLPVLYYSQHYHLDSGQIGLILSLTAIPGALALLVAGPLADRILAERPRSLMSLYGGSLVLLAALQLAFLASPNLPVAIVMMALPLFVYFLTQPAFFTLISLVLPARIRGIGVASITPFQLLGALLAPVLGHVADSSGITSAMLVLVPLTVVAGVIVMAGSGGVEADIRAALASSMADEEARRARESGRNKMLICRAVDVSYDGAQVLFGVDLDVEEGEILALLGTNGAGKSTLLRAIAGLQQASSGAIFFDGDEVTHAPADQNAARGVVYMPGGRAVFPTLTVAENLRAAQWLEGDGGGDGTPPATVEDVLHVFPVLGERMGMRAGDMSGGEQQMLAVGQALLMRPRLLMIDELSLGLAPQVVERLLGVVRRIHEQGTTIILVEQSVNVALTLARRAVFMERGTVRFDGPASVLASRGDIVHSVFLGRAVTANDLGASRWTAADRERVLEVRDLRVDFGGRHALSGVSLHVDAGEVVGIVGPNGAGKTTLFDAVAGFARSSGGSVTLGGVDVSAAPPDVRARLGLSRSFQNVRLFPALTVRENIAVALEQHLQSRSALLAAVWSPQTRRSEQRARRRVDNLVESVGLGPYADKFMNELSTGTRRIVDIACVLAAGPRVLLLDEPTSGLAQAETEMLGPLIGRMVRELGCGVLCIEHDLGLVAAISDRLIALRLGEVIAEGSPRTVLDDAQVSDALLGGASEAVLSRSIQLSGLT